MPTDKNRFSVSLDDQTYNIYKRFSQLDGRPLATVVASMLVDAREHFVQLGVLLQQAEALKGQTAEQQAAFVARIQMGEHRARAARDLTYSDLVTTITPPANDRATAGARERKAAKKGSQSLIHRHKSPNPLPTRVPAGLKSKKKGAGNAST